MASRTKNNKEKWEKDGPEMHFYHGSLLVIQYSFRSHSSSSHAMVSPMHQRIRSRWQDAGEKIAWFQTKGNAKKSEARTVCPGLVGTHK
jgi:hypothetical protein